MPLTLELYGSDPHSRGHLIIDRNNLLIIYPFFENKVLDEKSELNRDRFKALLKRTKHLYKNLYQDNLEVIFRSPDDPRHDALEHMCGYEKNNYHSHHKFKEDVDLDIIKLMFSNLNLNGYRDLINENCIHSILQISEEYFSALKNAEPLKKIEADYREEKNRENQKAEELIQEQQSGPLNFMMDRPFYTPSNLQFTFQGDTSKLINELLSKMSKMSQTYRSSGSSQSSSLEDSSEEEHQPIILRSRK